MEGFEIEENPSFVRQPRWCGFEGTHWRKVVYPFPRGGISRSVKQPGKTWIIYPRVQYLRPCWIRFLQPLDKVDLMDVSRMTRLLREVLPLEKTGVSRFYGGREGRKIRGELKKNSAKNSNHRGRRMPRFDPLFSPLFESSLCTSGKWLRFTSRRGERESNFDNVEYNS